MNDIVIIEAVKPDQVTQVASLLRDYLLWMRRCYRNNIDLIDLYFDEDEWESELADLPGHYGAPHGAIVLALVDGIPAGCLMMRGIGPDVGEMKRLFVRPAFRGLGLARAMVQKLARVSHARGYTRLCLESGALQIEAQSLYRSMGFKPIDAYHACPDWFIKIARFFEARIDVLIAGERQRRNCPDKIKLANNTASAVASTA